MADYTLTIYQDDDVTPLFEVGTAAAHAHPYLVMPEAFGEAEVDLQQGKALIGQINVRVIDPQDGATQADRYLTGLLANASGYSALNGRRAVLAQVSPAVVVQDGVCFGVTLADDFASFDLQLRDIRERGRKVQVFARSGTTTVFPRGVLDGYGRLPASYFGEDRWLVAPTDYLTGTYRVTPAQFGRQIGSIYFPTLPKIVPTKYVFTDRMRAASGWSTRIIDGESKAIHADIEILWRPVGGSTWTHLRDIETIPIDGITPFATQVAQIRDASGQLVTANVVAGILVGFVDDGQTRPTDGQRVEWLVLYVGPPSDDYPLHFEGTWGTFTRNLLRGDYCGVDESGNTIDPRLRYDESAVLAIDTPVRIRITEPQDDLRTVLEELCAGIGAAPALNDVGEISPIVYHLPDASETLPEINDSNAQPIAGWDHPTDNAVTVVEVKYQRDYRVPLDDDPKSERSAGDGLASREITIRRAPDDLVSALGEHELKLDLWMFRAAGTVEGQPVSGELVDEIAAQVAVERQHQAIDRFAYGGVSSAAQISASEFSALRAGDWVLDARSWRPNYATGKRGGNTFGQVVSIRKLNPAWWEVHLVDAGPEDQPIDQPTLGTVTAAADGIVSVPVDTVPEGGEARVDYALSSTVPATDSPLWTFLDRTESAATLKSPPQPAGSTFWIRSRGEGIARRPSAWTNAVSVVIPGTARVLAASVSIDALGRATASWDANASTLGMRLTFAAHSEDADPPDPLTSTQDVDASAGAAVLTGLTVRPGETLTVDFEPWTGWTGSAVSGTAGDKVRRQAGVAADESSYSLDLREIGRAPDDSTATFDGPWGSKLVEVRTFEALVAQPYAVDSWPAISGDPTQGPFTARVPVVFDVPPQGYARLVYVVGILADGTPGAIERLTILPTGTEPDLVTGLTVLVNDADGSATIRVDVADRTGSIRYAYAVDSDPDWPADATIEAGTVLALTGSATVTLAAGTVDYLETLRFRCCAYTGADGTGYDGAGDHGPIVGGEDLRLPSDVTLTQTTASEAGGVGTFGATLHDASGICTAIEKFTRSGAGDWVGPILITGTPTNGTEYTATVSLQEDHQSQIKIRATYTKNGSVGYVECPSPGFDAGQIPNIAVVPDIDEVARTASAAVSGDFDTASIKIVASTSATPAAATVRAATAINGRDLTPADIGALVTELTAGDTVYFAAFGYSEEDGGGNESTSLAVAQKTVGVVAPLLEVSSESEASSTGTFAVTLRDPSGVATAIYYRTKSGSGAWGSWTLKTGTPSNGITYTETVSLVEDHLSYIEFRVDYSLLGLAKSLSLKSSGFDKGKVPDLSLVPRISETGAVSCEIQGDFDTASAKVAASSSGYPTDTTVRAAPALNGRIVPAATVGALVTLNVGETAYLKAFGYSATGGGGTESSVAITASITRGASYTPKVQTSVTRSGTTATVALTVTDTLKRVTAVEFNKREGGSYGGWVSTWDAATGTAGADASLTRSEGVSLARDSELLWRVTYTDENGDSKTLGDAVTFPLYVMPKVKAEITRSGTTATVTVSAEDPRLVITDIQWSSQAQGGTATSFSSTWSSSTGTPGTDATLTRSKTFTVVDGADLAVRYQVTFTDESGASKIIADTLTVSNLASVAKTIRMPAAELMPDENSMSWSMIFGVLSPGALATAVFTGAVVLPVGVTITAVRARLYRANTSATATCVLYELLDDGSNSALATLSHSTTGWQTVSASLSKLVGSSAFVTLITLDPDTAANDASVMWWEFDYTVPSYAKTY